jgi:hypothetical protein
MKVKFREVKRRCREIVENYRKIRKDDREFPQFLIHGLAEDGTKGEVHLYRKPRGKPEYVSRASINYETIPELSVIIENLGKAWDATRPTR